jgi:hypothetical protein
VYVATLLRGCMTTVAMETAQMVFVIVERHVAVNNRKMPAVQQCFHDEDLLPVKIKTN